MASKSSSSSTTNGVATKKTTSSSSSPSSFLYSLVWLGAAGYAAMLFLTAAYQIRLLALQEYGLVIHEFDPYFNFRATEYLYEHGAKKFFQWFDYMSWYPLGRPVGTTIYPGMQFTAVWLKRFLLNGNFSFLPEMSLNDVCCYIPAWFGVIATFLVGCIAYECALPQNSNSNLWRFLVAVIKGRDPSTTTDEVVLGHGKAMAKRRYHFGFIPSPALECGIFAMGFMSIVPSHLMRSIGGGYDNESVAVAAMTATFYFWVRSLRSTDDNSWIFGAITGVAYFNMVAAWGGYVFVLNMVGLHAAMLVAMGRFTTKIYLSYSLFYVIGTLLAIQVPVVGWAPLKSLEQLGPCLVFCGYQVLQFCEVVRRKKNLTRSEAFKLRIQTACIVGVTGICLIWLITPKGYFGPVSSRVRGLFVKHSKTGNPLVDSVAEHQATSNRAYFQYLHHLCTAAPLGFFMTFFSLSDASSFLLAWGAASYFFSGKMVRLVLLTASIGATLGGISTGRMFAWCVRQVWNDGSNDSASSSSGKGSSKSTDDSKVSSSSSGKDHKRKKNIKKAAAAPKTSFDGLKSIQDGIDSILNSNEGVIIRRSLAVFIIVTIYFAGRSFTSYSWKLAGDLSHPTIIIKGRIRDGTTVKVDDYREAYWWLRDNTPEDSRIMAWWDYGYQITAIANRTTIADGNTWNHEHIALLGRALTSKEHEGHEIARHLADYVLIWGGGGGDDLAKSPHLARIANSVYRGMCPGDPTCRMFGFVDNKGTPSTMMEQSLLYRLHGHKIKKNVEANPSLFKEVYRSKYGRVRIFKIMGVSEESKQWCADPSNRICDVEGGWYCRGQYPPALQKILAERKDFAQLEDFNKGHSDEEYQQQYFEALNKPELARARARQLEKEMAAKREAAEKEEAATGGSSSSSSSSSSSEASASAASSSSNMMNNNMNNRPREFTPEEKDRFYNTWENTEDTTAMWQMISGAKVAELKNWLRSDPLMAYMRSEDGRGPMWWAFEQRNQEIVQIFMNAGVPLTDKDKDGKTPQDLLNEGTQ